MKTATQWALMAGIVLSFAAAGPAAEGEARQILDATGVKGGLIVHVGCGDGTLTGALRAGDGFLVHGLDADAGNVAAARAKVRSQGLYGPVSIDQLRGGKLPYADNLVNLVVAKDLGGVSMDEVLRVLVPNGVAQVGGTKTVKPRPADMGEWSHHLHAADGNPVTADRLVGPPRRMQWLAGPKWQRDHDTDANINALVTAGGRVFYMVDEAPISLVGANGLPDRWLLAARDAFNGILLWKVPVEKWGWREYKKTHYRTRHDVIPVNVHRRVVATADHVYATLGMGAPVSQLDAATGKVLHCYAGTEGTREILYHNGQLILTVPGKTGLRLIALDAATGKTVWATASEYAGTAKETTKLKIPRQPVLSAAADAESVCFLDGNEIVCLDRRTGAPRWRVKPQAKGQALWVGTLILRDGVVLYAEQNFLTALSATDGKAMWTRQAKMPGGLWFSWKDVYVIDGRVWTWGAAAGGRGGMSEAHGLNLKTGAVEKRVPLGNIFKVDHHHRCYRNKATSKFIIASRRGAEFVDLEGGPHSVNNWIRGICHLGMMPANGLLYAPPEPCKCYWYERVSDFCALAPAAASPSIPNPPRQTARRFRAWQRRRRPGRTGRLEHLPRRPRTLGRHEGAPPQESQAGVGGRPRRTTERPDLGRRAGLRRGRRRPHGSRPRRGQREEAVAAHRRRSRGLAPHLRQGQARLRLGGRVGDVPPRIGRRGGLALPGRPERPARRRVRSVGIRLARARQRADPG